MPVHDWTRVDPGIFHDFRLSWISRISDSLNSETLRRDHYSLLQRPWIDSVFNDQGLSGIGQVQASEYESEVYARIADRIAIYRECDEQVVAYVEIVSPGCKANTLELDRLFERLDSAIRHGRNVLLVDIHPPGRFDPRGTHSAFWERRYGPSRGCTPAEPFGLAAYCADFASGPITTPKACFQPFAFDEPVPDMPLFLYPDHYVNVPLEQTYQAAWATMPERWKQVIASGLAV